MVNEIKDKRLLPWNIRRFPVKTRNMFVGRAKQLGKTVPIALMEAVQDWLSKYKER